MILFLAAVLLSADRIDNPPVLVFAQYSFFPSAVGCLHMAAVVAEIVSKRLRRHNVSILLHLVGFLALLAMCAGMVFVGHNTGQAMAFHVAMLT